MKDIDKKMKQIKEVMNVQGADGNWNYDPYMHGMFNGMEMLRCILEDDEPNFKQAPDKWLRNREWEPND